MDASTQSRSSSQAITPLRQRMIEDMRMRELCDKTQSQYILAVRKLASYLGRSPDTASVEDLRRFQLWLVDQGTSPVTLNVTITGLKFLLAPMGRAVPWRLRRSSASMGPLCVPAGI